MSLHYTFNWPKGPQDVILTGTFDNWSQSLPLVKQADGSFSLQLPLPPRKEDIFYKYVVDGQWKVNPDEKSAKDSEGNHNNIIEAEDLKELLVVPGALIPETGLAFANNNREKLPESGTHHDEDLKTTVMPKEVPHHASIAGEPGIYVPKDEEQLNAFRTFETQDVEKLNQEETPQEYTQGITPAAIALSEQHDHIGSNASGEHTKEVLDHEKPENVIGSNKEPVRQSVSGGITPAAIALAEEHNHVGPNASGEHTKEVLEGKDEYLSPEDKKKQKKKVKRSQYKAKKKKRDADAAAAAVAGNGEGNFATSTEEEFTPEPESASTNNNNTIGVSVPRTTRKSFSLDPETNRDEDVPQAESFDNQQKTTRESFSHAVPYETEETAVAPTDKEEPKNDHSNAAAIAAGALGGGAVGTGLASQSQTKTLDPKATSSEPPFGTDHLNEGKEVDAAPIGEKARETSQVVPVAGGVVGGGSNQPSVADPSSGVSKNTTTEPTTTSAPETKDIPSTQKVVPLLPTEGVDPKATAEPTTVDSKSPVTSSAAIANDEEIIIAASGNRKDIEAAVEAEEGHDVTLEEITPTKSEREELTREAEIASHAKGPITIEQVVVPQSELHPHDEIAAATAPTSEISKSKDTTTKSKDATTKPTETTTKNQTSSQTTSGNKQQTKKTNTSEAKKEEKKKGGFRGFLKKLVT